MKTSMHEVWVRICLPHTPTHTYTHVHVHAHTQDFQNHGVAVRKGTRVHHFLLSPGQQGLRRGGTCRGSHL